MCFGTNDESAVGDGWSGDNTRVEVATGKEFESPTGLDNIHDPVAVTAVEASVDSNR